MCVCVSVYLIANSSETAIPNELKFWRDDFPWGADGFRLKIFWIRQTVRKITEKMLTVLATNLLQKTSTIKILSYKIK